MFDIYLHIGCDITIYISNMPNQYMKRGRERKKEREKGREKQKLALKKREFCFFFSFSPNFFCYNTKNNKHSTLCVGENERERERERDIVG